MIFQEGVHSIETGESDCDERAPRVRQIDCESFAMGDGFDGGVRSALPCADGARLKRVSNLRRAAVKPDSSLFQKHQKLAVRFFDPLEVNTSREPLAPLGG